MIVCLKRGDDLDNIKLLYPNISYKEELLEYIDEFKAAGEIIHGGASIDHKDSIEEWLVSVENNRSEETVENNLMPASNYLLIREDDDRLIGFLDIRHKLNDFLLKRGGHIGYSIRESERKKGYGSSILKLGLIECEKLGIDRVLVTCDKENIASAKIIQKNGGVLENEVEIQGRPLQRYWIDI